MISRNLVTFTILALCFLAVLALFGGLAFPALFNHVGALRQANSHKHLGLGLTESERHLWQALLLVTYVGMLMSLGFVVFVAGKLRGISTGTLVMSLLMILLVVAVISLPVLLFVGSCHNLFSAYSC